MKSTYNIGKIYCNKLAENGNSINNKIYLSNFITVQWDYECLAVSSILYIPVTMKNAHYQNSPCSIMVIKLCFKALHIYCSLFVILLRYHMYGT